MRLIVGDFSFSRAQNHTSIARYGIRCCRTIEGNQPILPCQFLILSSGLSRMDNPLVADYVERSRETWKMNRQCVWWFFAAGLTISIAMVCIYYALDLGKVSVVIPIASTGPFFSLILAATFLRDVERVTSRIVLSAAMIVGGMVLLKLWK